jgi:capsular polysaccharide biosynthesis protein
MDLVDWIKALGSKWWIAVATFIITFGAVLAFTLLQKPVYQVTATLVVRPNSLDIADTARYTRLLETLSRSPEITNTFAEVAASRLIKGRALQSLGLSAEQGDSVPVQAQALEGKNVVQVLVSGTDPILVRDLANAVSEQSLLHATAVYEGYELTVLDRATVPRSPIKPRLDLSLVFGTLLGIGLGITLALLAHYFEVSLKPAAISPVLQQDAGAES